MKYGQRAFSKGAMRLAEEEICQVRWKEKKRLYPADPPGSIEDTEVRPFNK